MKKEEGASRAPAIFYLHKIFSIKKQLQVHDILMHFNPTHEERLWLVGFLKYAGYTQREVLRIINEHCLWHDYDPSITAYQVGTIYNHRIPRTLSCSCSSSHNTKRRARKWDLSPVEKWRINLARTSEMDRRLTAFLNEKAIPTYETPGTEQMEFKPETLLREDL